MLALSSKAAIAAQPQQGARPGGVRARIQSGSGSCAGLVAQSPEGSEGLWKKIFSVHSVLSEDLYCICIFFGALTPPAVATMTPDDSRSSPWLAARRLSLILWGRLMVGRWSRAAPRHSSLRMRMRMMVRMFGDLMMKSDGR